MARPQGAFYTALGARIRAARIKAKSSQEDLARAVGLARTSITNIEKGRQPLQAHVLAKIAESLSTEPAALLPPAINPDPTASAAALQKYRPTTQKWVKQVMANPGSKREGTDGD